LARCARLDRYAIRQADSAGFGPHDGPILEELRLGVGPLPGRVGGPPSGVSSMTKEMIICANDHETRVAILEDDLVSEIFVERERQRGVVGNIYKGRVSKVLPGMQSAFVDVGLERDGFLYVSDVVNEEFDKLDAEDEGDEKRDDGAKGARTEPKIEDLLREGQEVLVQVAKEPLGTKGARLTSHASLAGRFLVFMPTVDHVGVSRKIESRDERARLRGIVREYREQHGFSGGIIIRTAAAGRSQEDILTDLDYFNRIWTEVRKKTDSLRAPAVVYREDSLIAKLLRDLLTEEFTAVRIDNAQEHQRVLQLVERILPALGPRVKLYEKPFPIFEEYGVQAELDKALRSKVWLKSGGSIVINQTEALVAIDVNTGRYVGKRTAGRLEDTIVKTNLEAAREIVRQIRLRDLGGIIVLDFIDMEDRKNRQKVFQALELELKRDRAPSKALQVSDFGLIVITRKRVKQSLERVLTEPCPYCSGSGVIKSSATICYEILAEVKKLGSELNGHAVVLRVNPDIARALKEEENAVLRDLRVALGKEVTIHPDVHLHHEQFDVMAVG
jgi:ribonuclease G